MVKIIDLDKLFDKYISGYVYKNVGKIKPEEIENEIPVMYEKFGDEPIAELGGKTPNAYYKDFSAAELVSALREHVRSGVPVSDFLVESVIAADDGEKAVVTAIKDDPEEEFAAYLLNIYEMLGASDSLEEILGFVLYDFSENLRELATEILSEKADLIKESVLNAFDGAEDGRKDNLAEILSHCGKDDRVLSVLISEFAKNKDKRAQYAGYLSKFGDDRALPCLYEAIEDEKIRYADFTELRFAIESLGGEYKKERSFTGDKDYAKLKGIKKSRII